NGEELALPVLEGFEPKLARRPVFPERLRRAAAGQVFCVGFEPAAHRVQDKGESEERRKRDGQRILVKDEPCSAAPDRPRRTWITCVRPRILVLLGGLEGLGLGGAF